MSKILILDDSTDLLDALEFFLTGKGYEVKCISNPDDLLQTMKIFSPDVLVLDIFLPQSDGREICKQLRGNIETKYLCILMFSASPTEVDHYKKYGADEFIEKPFGLKELMEKIEATLEKCRAHTLPQ